MLKLQIGENFISLTTKEEDLFFELLQQNYDTIRNSPTFNAIYNWLKENHNLSKETKEYLRGIPTVTVGDNQIPCKTIPKSKKEVLEDPWKSEKENLRKTEDYTALRKLLGNLLDEKGYYVAL